MRKMFYAILNQQLSRANEYSEEDYEELEEEKLQVIDFLLFYNANPVPKDIRGNTPLHVAVVSGYSSVILEKLIAIGNNINEKNYYGETALSLAARSGNTKAVNYLIEQGAKKDLTSLICFDSQPNVLRRIKKVKFVEILDQEYNTLLHYAARRGFIDVIKELLHKGAKINLFNRSHQTPLDVAESTLQTEVFKYLAKEGGKTHGELSNNCIWDWCCGYWLPNTQGKIRLSYSFAGAKKDICNKYGFVKESIPLAFLQQNLAIKVMKYISDILNITFYKSRNIEEADLFIGQFSDKEIWNYSGAELKYVDHWIISKASIAINNYRFKDSTIESYPSFSFMNILQSFGRVLGLRYSKESDILYKNQSMLDEYYEVGFSRNDLEKLSSRYSFTR